MRLGNYVTKMSLTAILFMTTNLSAKGLDYTFVTDHTFYYKSKDQSVIRAKLDFNEPAALKKFSLHFGEWHGKELLIENMPAVKPDFMLERDYVDGDGHAVWFQLIRGRVERAVHVPRICYYNAGWQIIKHDIDNVRVGKYTIPCGKMVTRKDNVYASELYFYLWKNPERDFMKGCVMFRIASLSTGNNEAEKTRLIKKFIRDLFTEVE